MNLPKIDQLMAWILGLTLGGATFGGVYFWSKIASNKEFNLKKQRAEEAEKYLQLALRQNPKNGDSNHESLDTQHGKTQKPSSDHSQESATADFGYSGSLAPWRWADLKSSWKLCASGKRQSPVDISNTRLNHDLKSLKFHYQFDVSTLQFANSTVVATPPQGSWVEFDSERFELKSVSFRTPSEHRINGLPYEMEVQLHHEELSGRKLSIAVLATPAKSQTTRQNESVDSLLARAANALPRFPGETSEIERANWAEVLPRLSEKAKQTYWTYQGSKTTPPCTEDVTWVVLTNTAVWPKSVISAFETLQKNNARPVAKRLGSFSIYRSDR